MTIIVSNKLVIPVQQKDTTNLLLCLNYKVCEPVLVCQEQICILHLLKVIKENIDKRMCWVLSQMRSKLTINIPKERQFPPKSFQGE